jgi:receptor protein-tyrosine kinase
VVEQWWLVALCAVVACGAAFGASSQRTKQYDATSTLEIGSVDLVSIFLAQDVQVSDADPERQTAAAKELFNLPNVRDRAAAALGGAVSSSQILSRLTVSVAPSSDILKVVARDSDPKTAQRISNAMTDAFIAQRKETTKAKLAQAQTQVRDQYGNLSAKDRAGILGQGLQNRLRQVNVLGALDDGGVTIIQGARVPTDPVSPKPKRDGLIGLFVGLLVGIAIAVLRARLDDRVRDTEELSSLWSLPIVGLIPQSGTLKNSGRSVPEPAALEALSLARTNLRYLRVGGAVKTVVVTSALAAEGKSTLTWNLGIAAALASSKVLVVEGDLRRPVISERLGLSGPGFSEVLAGIADLTEVIQTVAVQDSAGSGVATHIDVLPAGLVPPSPVALLEGDQTPAALTYMRERYDIVLIDTPPSTVVADAVALMSAVDGVLVVSRLGAVRRGSVKRLREILTGVDAPVIGQIVNSDVSAKGYGYYSTYTKKSKASRRAATSSS